MPTFEEQKRLYDATCKEVLSEKGILAHIMHDCMAEFHGLPGTLPSTASREPPMLPLSP